MNVDVNNFENIVSTIARTSYLAVDTETTGLNPYLGDYLFSLIVSTSVTAYYFDFKNGGLPRSFISKLKPIFEDPEKYLFFVNAKYDAAILRNDGIKILAKVVDAPTIARLEYSKHNEHRDVSFLSLDYLARHYLRERKDDSVKKYIAEHKLIKVDKMGKNAPDYMAVPNDITIPYGERDAVLTYKMCMKIIDLIKVKAEEQKNLSLYKNTLVDLCAQETKLTKVLIDMENTGFLVDENYIKEAYKHELDVSKSAEKEVLATLGSDFNLRSSKQVASFLVSNGVQLPMTDKGNLRVDKKTIKNVDIPVIHKIIESKEAQKKANTYYLNFLKMKDKNNIIHCQLHQETARTGRFSSSSPNLQNLSKEEDTTKEFLIRRSFIPWEGGKLFFFDYKQQEMHVMVDMAGERTVLDKMKTGLDFYEATSATIKDITGIDLKRKQAKAISLGLAYGEGIDLLAENLECSRQAASEFKAAFFRGLPELLRFKENLERYVKVYSRIFNPFGRITYLSHNESYKALNAFIQGTCADIIKKCLILIHELTMNHKSKLLLTVHDEVILWIHDDETFLIKDIENVMIQAYDFIFMPLKVDIEFSDKSWADKVKWSAATSLS